MKLSIPGELNTQHRILFMKKIPQKTPLEDENI